MSYFEELHFFENLSFPLTFYLLNISLVVFLIPIILKKSKLLTDSLLHFRVHNRSHFKKLVILLIFEDFFMFIYKVKAAHSLISYVSISEQYMTLWQRKGAASELGTFLEKNRDLLECIQDGYDPRHKIFHPEEQLPKDHIHLIFKRKMNEETFAELMRRLSEASTLEGRQKEYNTFFEHIDKQRIEKAAAHFPPYVQNIIDNFDKTSPHLAPHDIEDLKKAYNEYQLKEKNSKYIFQNLYEKVNQIYCELSTVATEEKNWKNELEILNNCRQILKLQTLFTLTPILTALKKYLLKLKEESVTEIDKILSERENKEYPLPRLAELITSLNEDLTLIKEELQGSWYKRILNFAAFPISYIALKVGMGVFGTGLIGLTAWLGADAINRARDWYKLDSYHELRSTVAELNTFQQQSFEAGLKAAESTGEQVLSLFNKAAWAHPREYYGALASKQLNDGVLIDKFTKRATP